MQREIQIQLIGDSMVKRFDYFVKGNQTDLQIISSIGLSGARIHELKEYLKSHRVKFNVSIPLVVFIGTNDIFKNTEHNHMCNQYKSLLRYVRNCTPGISIILVQLPTFPRALTRTGRTREIDMFNKYLATLANSKTKIFSFQDWLDQGTDFHKFYAHTSRVDGIHLNNRGNKKFSSHLLSFLK
jgi:lysophospholipase L1-like esterase